MIKVTIGNNVSRQSIIIDENTTLRNALEQQGIDYTIGMTSLDGSTLAPGDLDKTFTDFGITEKCYLLNVVKADNAAAVKIVGGACVVESDYTLDQLKTLEKFRPNSLALFENKGQQKEMIFKVGTTKGNGSICECGVSFGETPSNGHAAVTLMIPEGTQDAKKWAEERIGVSILRLKKVEEGLDDAVADVAQEQAAVAAAIQVL